MPITLFNGGPQVTILASQLKAPRNITKMSLAGALHEESIECVKTDINDLPVPATSEFVIDAEISITELVDEGPYGTWTDYYDYVRKMPKMLIKAIYHRDDPIYQIAAFPPEGRFSAEVMTGLSMTQIYKSFAPEVEAVRVLSSWGAMTLIALDKERKRKGSPMKVGLLAASVQPALKMCIITDNDYDYWNIDQILWTICMKWAPTKGTQLVGPLPGFLVPTEKYETGEDLLKYAVIIDATEPPAPYNEIYKRGIVDVPKEIKEKAKEILRKYESL
jgi:UbiD family decarboxylase